MQGAKKSAKFGLMRKGEYISVSVLLNTLTKFAKLQVGKHVVSAKQKRSGDPLFPLAVALSGLIPLTKVWVEYQPLPKNTFVIKINDADFYSLPKEEVDYDPTQTETLRVAILVNGKLAASESMPWIIEDFSDKVESILGMDQLTSLIVEKLNCKPTVANEFLDLLCGFDIPEQGLEKLVLSDFLSISEPFEEEVLTRLAN